jgi:iron complex transport system substrate-binding protein
MTGRCRGLFPLLLGVTLVLGGWNAAGAGQATPEAGCRPVAHELGAACVPPAPRRVATLDFYVYELVAALGVEPVAVNEPDNLPSYLGELSPDVADIGTNDQPNLETLAALDPDLIIAPTYHEDVYDELSRIAPTVAVYTSEGTRWKESLVKVGEALGKPLEAERLLAEYEERVRSLQVALGAQRSEIDVSAVAVFGDGPFAFLEGSTAGLLLADVGLPRPPAQRGPGEFLQITEERIPDLDGDVLFVATPNREQARLALDQLTRNPLWSRLGVVQRGNAHQVGQHWILAGPLSSGRMLDDLERHLLDEARA